MELELEPGEKLRLSMKREGIGVIELQKRLKPNPKRATVYHWLSGARGPFQNDWDKQLDILFSSQPSIEDWQKWRLKTRAERAEAKYIKHAS